MAIPSQSFLPEEGCHWLDIGFSPDVFILDVVVLLGILISVVVVYSFLNVLFDSYNEG